jgi:hypothetical protein
MSTARSCEEQTSLHAMVEFHVKASAVHVRWNSKPFLPTTIVGFSLVGEMALREPERRSLRINRLAEIALFVSWTIESEEVEQMPISRDDFNKGRSDNGLRSSVVNFLEKNHDSGFTLDEICSGITAQGKEGEAGSVNAYQIITILHGLVKEGTVVEKDLPEATYYMWK